ncbi:MAG: hypothetical protein GXP58_06575 [Deltaproteobacteria bacterium]|nr:hypothetical protein [Deltaproteobacteria bacterium]
MDREWHVIALGAIPFSHSKERIAENVLTHFVETEEEAVELLSTCSRASILILHDPPTRDAFWIFDGLVRRFPGILCAVVVDDEMIPAITNGFTVPDDAMLMEKPRSKEASDLMLFQMARSGRAQWKKREEYHALEVSKKLAEEYAEALTRLHEDLAGLVHCGQYLQETLDLEMACHRVVDTFRDLGMECMIDFEEDPEKRNKLREEIRNAEKNFTCENGSVRVFFSKADYVGSIEVRPTKKIPIDDGRIVDLVHFFKNQLVAFLDRYHRIEEREKTLGLYNSVLEKLEEIVDASDFNQKTQHVREGIAGNTETIVKILDKLRNQVPEEALPWIDEAEMSLQFADKVSQQINTLTGTLREILCVMNPELAVEFYAQDQESSESVCRAGVGSQQDVDDLLAGLGM